MATVALTVDLDPLSAYYAIHGFSEAPDDDPLLRHGLRRLLELLRAHDVPATLFVTGASLGPGEWALLREAASMGCELADHSFSHDYRLSLRPTDDIVTDLRRNTFAIRESTGVAPVGFRAPGYNTSPSLRAAIAELGYRYDSSAFPSPCYLAAKQFIIWLRRLAGRRSVSFVSSFRDAFGPQEPYRLAEGPIELPITTFVPLLGLPLIGTALVAFPAPLFHFVVSRALQRNFAVVELHAIDLVDANDGPELRPLLGKQPDLKHPVERKLRRLDRTLERFKERGFSFETLASVAERCPS